MLKIFHKGSVFGGVLLIAGSCIGAGMLALPIITGIGGFVSSIIMLFLCWLFMTFTAFLLLEANSSFDHRVNIVTMAEKSFGMKGRILSWVVYLFLFYSLLIAYISGGENILASALKYNFDLIISPPIVGIIFTLFFGLFIFLGTTSVDFFNRILMVGLIATYFGMLFLGMRFIHGDNFFHFNLHFSLVGLPILITSFGFHNMIPSLVVYMDYDYSKVKKAILGGSLIALFIYLLWDVIVLGIVPIENLLTSYLKGTEAAELLMRYLKSTWTRFFVQWFAFFAIVTSFLAQGLALMHFIADGLKVNPTKKNSFWLIFLTLLPPTFFAVINPNLFFRALSFAGGICAVILFCLLPALMIWKGRYRESKEYSYKAFGGKLTLVLVLAFSFFILLQEILRLFFM